MLHVHESLVCGLQLVVTCVELISSLIVAFWLQYCVINARRSPFMRQTSEYSPAC